MVLSKLTARENVTLSLPGLKRVPSGLDQAVDALNRVYGKNTIYFGGAQTALNSAPTWTAFNRLPDLETERVPFPDGL